MMFFDIGNHLNHVVGHKKKINGAAGTSHHCPDIIHHFQSHFINQVMNIQIVQIERRAVDMGGFADSPYGHFMDIFILC